MLDMLVTVPTLGRYLGTINIHEDLIVDEDAGTTEIFVIADRAKNGIGTCADLPVDLVEHFKQHVVDFRPYLKGSESDWLFPSRNGGPRTPQSIRLLVRWTLMNAFHS